MGKRFKNLSGEAKVVAYILLVAAASLFIGGFFVPPMGEIDGSVLKAGGMLIFGVLVLGVWDQMDKSDEAKIKYDKFEANVKK